MSLTNLAILISGQTRVLQIGAEDCEYITNAEIRCIEEDNFSRNKQFVLYITFLDGSKYTAFLSSSDFYNNDLTLSRKVDYLAKLIRSRLFIANQQFSERLAIPQQANQTREPTLRSGGQVYTIQGNRIEPVLTETDEPGRLSRQVTQVAEARSSEDSFDEDLIMSWFINPGVQLENDLVFDRAMLTRGAQGSPYSGEGTEIVIDEDRRSSDSRELEERVVEEDFLSRNSIVEDYMQITSQTPQTITTDYYSRRNYDLEAAHRRREELFERERRRHQGAEQGRGRYQTNDYNHAYHEATRSITDIDLSTSERDRTAVSVFEVTELKEPEETFNPEVKNTKRKVTFF